MKSDSVLVTIAVVAVLASFAGLLMNYGSFSNFNNLFTGFATENGTVNVTVGTSTLIEIISANGTADSTALDWGTGSVDVDADYALLVTNGTVENGTWTAVNDEGFVIQNKGNTNVNLTVSATDDAESFIGPGAVFQYNLSNYLAGSCASGSHDFDTFVDFSTSETPACDNFSYVNESDQLRMDILLQIPLGTVSEPKSTTVTLSYAAA